MGFFTIQSHYIIVKMTVSSIVDVRPIHVTLMVANRDDVIQMYEQEIARLKADYLGAVTVATPHHKRLGDHIVRGQTIHANEFLESENRQFVAIMQSDGNFVVYTTRKPIFDTGTYRNGGHHFILQGDGNLVVYTADGRPVWSPNIFTADILVMQNDGNLVAYTHDRRPVWASNSVTPGTGRFPRW
jgi:hypothetical protein